MPDVVLNKSQLSQLDSNIRKMVDSGLEREDIDAYTKDFKNNIAKQEEGKAMAAKVPSFKDFAAERGVYTPRPGEIQIPSDIVERVPSLSRKAEIAKDVQEAPERIKIREEKKEKAKVDALRNNTIKALTASGTKFTEGDAVYKKMQENIKSVVEKGAMTLSADAAGNPVYKRSAGIIESFINNFETSRKDINDSEVFRKSSDAESVKIAEEIIKGIEQQAVPSGTAAEISGMFGSAAPLLGRAVIGGGAAAKFLPGPAKAITALGSFAATISPSYDQAYKQGAVELYAKGIEEMKRQKRINGQSDELSQQEKEEAMRMAKNEASVSGFAEGIFTAGLSSIPLGSSVAGQSFKKAMVNFAKNTAKEVPRNVTLGAASEVIKDVSARNAGYNITTAETLNNVLDRGGQDLVTSLAFETAFNIGDFGSVPKYVKAAATNYLSTIPTPEFNNFAKDLEGRGVVEPGFAEKATADVNKFKESKAKVASFIPEDDMPSFAGLIEKKTNLENQKKSTDPAFHAKIDEQITAVDERIKKMQESPNPIFDEVDELTGDTGDATPITESEIEKSIEYADGFTPETTETKMADGEKELFSETDSKGRTSTFFSNTKEKDGRITTTFSFNRSDKGPSQRNNSTLGIPVEKALGDKYTIDEDYIPEGAKVVGVSEIRITEEGSAATVTLENEGQRYQAEVKLKSNTTYDAELKALEQPVQKSEQGIEKRKSELQAELDDYKLKPLKLNMSDEAYKDLLDKRDARISEINSELKALEQPAPEPTQEVEKLRAEEQKELASAIPNIEEYKVDGIVDRTKITNEEDLAKFDEIYNKYDKLITPLLEPAKEPAAIPETPKEPSPFKPVEGFEGFEVTAKEGKKERYVDPERVLSSATIRLKTRAEQEAIIDAIGDPMDARQAAMIALMGRPNISYESFIKETGFGKGEVKTRRGKQAEVAASPFTRKEGATIESVAESVWENLPDESQSKMDSQDVRNEIIDLLGTYKDQNEIRDAYIEAYSPKEISDEEAMSFYSRYAEEIQPIEKEWDDWSMERGEKEMALELDENYVDKLIQQYELTKEVTEPTGRKKEGVVEEAGVTYATKEKGVIEGGDVKKYIDEQATPEESTDFDGFAKRELAREGFDAEYKSARVEGETKEQYLIRKYCK